jgi:hypothetical protein
MSISEKDADKIVKRLEKNVPEQGAWGSCHPSGKLLTKSFLLAVLLPKLF